MKYQTFSKKLKSAGYEADPALTRKIFPCVALISEQYARGAYLIGPPGAGKTFLANVLSEVLQAKLFTFSCDAETRRSDLVQKLAPDASSAAGFVSHPGILLEASAASQNEEVIVLIDEWDKTRKESDSFLLRVLQSGEINFPGISECFNMENSIFFVVMNTERILEGPMKRRLPVVEMDRPPVAVMERMLARTHATHGHMEAALALYERSLRADLDKAVTVQELRQLLDACSLLGKDADWDTLVFQYVTKSGEDHTILANTPQKQPRSRSQSGDRPRLKVDEFGEVRRTRGKRGRKEMPPLRVWVGEMAGDASLPPESEEDFGQLSLTTANYHQLATGLFAAGKTDEMEEAGIFPSLAKVWEEKIVLESPMELSKLEWGVTLDGATFFRRKVEALSPKDLYEGFKLISYSTEVYSLTSNEILLKIAEGDSVGYARLIEGAVELITDSTYIVNHVSNSLDRELSSIRSRKANLRKKDEEREKDERVARVLPGLEKLYKNAGHSGDSIWLRGWVKGLIAHFPTLEQLTSVVLDISSDDFSYYLSNIIGYHQKDSVIVAPLKKLLKLFKTAETVAKEESVLVEQVKAEEAWKPKLKPVPEPKPPAKKRSTKKKPKKKKPAKKRPVKEMHKSNFVRKGGCWVLEG